MIHVPMPRSLHSIIIQTNFPFPKPKKRRQVQLRLPKFAFLTAIERVAPETLQTIPSFWKFVKKWCQCSNILYSLNKVFWATMDGVFLTLAFIVQHCTLCAHSSSLLLHCNDVQWVHLPPPPVKSNTCNEGIHCTRITSAKGATGMQCCTRYASALLPWVHYICTRNTSAIRHKMHYRKDALKTPDQNFLQNFSHVFFLNIFLQIFW